MQIYDTNTLEKAISKYGKDSQVDMAVEEMSELVKALLKDSLCFILERKRRSKLRPLP